MMSNVDNRQSHFLMIHYDIKIWIKKIARHNDVFLLTYLFEPVIKFNHGQARIFKKRERSSR